MLHFRLSLPLLLLFSCGIFVPVQKVLHSVEGQTGVWIPELGEEGTTYAQNVCVWVIGPDGERVCWAGFEALKGASPYEIAVGLSAAIQKELQMVVDFAVAPSGGWLIEPPEGYTLEVYVPDGKDPYGGTHPNPPARKSLQGSQAGSVSTT